MPAGIPCTSDDSRRSVAQYSFAREGLGSTDPGWGRVSGEPTEGSRKVGGSLADSPSTREPPERPHGLAVLASRFDPESNAADRARLRRGSLGEAPRQRSRIATVVGRPATGGEIDSRRGASEIRRTLRFHLMPVSVSRTPKTPFQAGFRVVTRATWPRVMNCISLYQIFRGSHNEGRPAASGFARATDDDAGGPGGFPWRTRTRAST